MTLFKDTWQTGHTGHVAEHNRIAKSLNSTIYSANYATLQDAVDAAIGGSVVGGASSTRLAAKTLVIKPGTYILAQPLKITSVRFLNIIAYGVTLINNVPMQALIECNGCSKVTISGFRLIGDANHALQYGIYLYHHPATSVQATDECRFDDIFIGGTWIQAAAQIGSGDGSTTDTSAWHGLMVHGVWTPGNNTNAQYGVRIGIPNGINSNNLVHNFYNVVLNSVGVAVSVQGSQAGIFGYSINTAQLAFEIMTTSYFHVCAGRAELLERIAVIGAGASSVTQVTIQDSLLASSVYHADAEVIQVTQGGCLNLINVHIRSSNIVPKIRANPNEPLQINLLGLHFQNLPSSAKTTFLALGANAVATVQGYTENVGAGITDSVIGIAQKVGTGALRRLVFNTDGTVSNEAIT